MCFQETRTRNISRWAANAMLGFVFAFTGLSGGVAACGTESAKTVLSTPADWNVLWYQWKSRDTLILRYLSRQGGECQTVSYNTLTSAASQIDLPVDSRNSISFERPSWLLSPNGRWMLGCDGGVHAVYDARNPVRAATTGIEVLGSKVFWGPDSRTFLECEESEDTTITRLVPLRGRIPQRGVGAKFELPGHPTIVGFTSADAIVCAAPAETMGIDRRWEVRTVTLKDGRTRGATWSLAIPTARHLVEAHVSRDLKRICWIMLCENTPRDRRSPKDSTMTVSVWVTGAHGERPTHVATLDGVELDERSYAAHGGPTPEYFQWTRDDRGLSYLWKGRLMTVGITAASCRTLP